MKQPRKLNRQVRRRIAVANTKASGLNQRPKPKEKVFDLTSEKITLKKRARELMEIMRDTGEEMVVEGNDAYVGTERTHPELAIRMINAMAIELVPGYHIDSVPVYFRITPIGLAILRRPEVEWEVRRAVHNGFSFTLKNDRVRAQEFKR